MLDALLDDTFPWKRDTDGRPLAEGAAPQRVQAPTEIVACPFDGDRAGRPMNLSAWRQVARGFDHALAELCAVSGPTASDAWLATSRVRWRPLVHDEPVPVAVAVGYKLALGLQRPLTSWLLLAPGAADRPLAELVAPDDLLGRLDEEGWLVGARQACPAPPARIVEAWRALAGVTERCAPAPLGGGIEGAIDVVVGAWALLGAAREVVRQGRLAELPSDWRIGTPPPPSGPEVLRLLLRPGPTALVREVPRFEPRWARHVFCRGAVPDAVEEAVRAASEAMGSDRPLAALDEGWGRLRGGAGLG